MTHLDIDAEEWDEEEDYGPVDDELDDMGYPIGARVVNADFGLVEVEDEEHGQWLRQRDNEMVTRECTMCDQQKRMHRDYSICGSCADRMERGEDF